jgi:hypothetical protein
MSASTIIKAEALLLDERFLDWARGQQNQPGFQWVEEVRSRSESQEMEVLEAFTLYQRLVRPEGVPAQAADLRARLLMRLDRQNDPSDNPKRSFRPTRLVFVAVACLLAGLFFALNFSHSTTRDLAGDGKETLLEDGTRVQLASSSTLTFQEGFSKKQSREVWVKGKAAFHVKHTPEAKPFLVHTPAFDIEVTGTRFIVNNEAHAVSVLLQEGSVNLRFPSGALVKMKPGDFFSLETTVKNELKEVTSPQLLERHIVFDNTPIAEVIREIESRYQVRVEVLSPELQNKQITGVLPNDNLQILLQALEVAMDCKITQQQKTLFFKSSL